MSYVRIPLVCQDFQLGFRTLRQATENNNLLWEQLAAKHLTAPRSFPGDSIVGHHNDYFVPRSTANWHPQENLDGTWFAAGTSPYRGASFGVPVLRDVGRWRIPLYDTSGVLVTGAILLDGSVGATVGRHIDLKLYQPTGGTGLFVDVATWDIAGASAPATDFMSFSLTLWARR